MQAAKFADIQGMLIARQQDFHFVQGFQWV
jgi:hypothetical protein